MSQIVKPIWVRMREAAAVLSEVSAELNPNDAAGWCVTHWSSSMLHAQADKWEREDAETAEREQLLEDLARELYDAEREGEGKPWDRLLPNNSTRHRMIQTAQRLMTRFDVKQAEVPF